MMVWDVELSKQISMAILLAVLLLMCFQYKKIEKVNMIFFAGFIMISTIDFFCYFYFEITKIPTDQFYVLGIFVMFFLYLVYYYKLLYISFLKKIQLIILALFIVNVLIMFCVESDFLQKFSFNSFYVNILLLTFSIILFLYQTFNSDRIFEIKNYLPFWISAGSLLFYIGIIPILYFRATISYDIYFFFLFSLNLINNGVIVLGLLWNKPDKEKQT